MQFGTLQNVGYCIWLPKQFEAPRLQVGLTTVLGASQLRKFVEFGLSRPEYRMLPSPVPSQPQSVNADHCMFFKTWPLHQIVVIGPYQWSALATNKLMG